jgi:MFS family permease
MGTPWLALLAPVAYNEGGLLLYGTLAIGWALNALMRDNADRRRTTDALFAGAMTGFACGVKLTAGPLLIAGLPLALFAGAVGFRSLSRTFIAATILGVVGLAIFSPWAIRNFAWARNPVFPEANSVFRSDRFTPVQDQRWKQAHAATAAQKSVPMRLRAAKDQILFDWRFGYVLLPLAIVAMLLTRGRPGTWFLATLLLVMTGFWLGFTHLQGRFFVLAIPVAALMIAQLERRPFVIVSAVLIVIQALIAIGWTAGHERLALLRDNAAFRIDLGRPAVLDTVPEDAALGPRRRSQGVPLPRADVPAALPHCLRRQHERWSDDDRGVARFPAARGRVRRLRRR